MGASFTLLLRSLQPDAFAAAVLFYGESGANLSDASTQFLCHYGEADSWEPLAEVKEMTAKNVTTHVYAGAGHWFFEDDRPDHYNAEAALLAWQRTISFFKSQLPN